MGVNEGLRKNSQLNSAVLQLANSHGPTAQLNVSSVQMQVRLVREQPLTARAGSMQGGWGMRMLEDRGEVMWGCGGTCSAGWQSCQH